MLGRQRVIWAEISKWHLIACLELSMIEYNLELMDLIRVWKGQRKSSKRALNRVLKKTKCWQLSSFHSCCWRPDKSIAQKDTGCTKASQNTFNGQKGQKEGQKRKNVALFKTRHWTYGQGVAFHHHWKGFRLIWKLRILINLLISLFTGL